MGSFSYTTDTSGDGIIDFNELDDLSLTVNNGGDGTSTTISGKKNFTRTGFYYRISDNALTNCISPCFGQLGNNVTYSQIEFHNADIFALSNVELANVSRSGSGYYFDLFEDSSGTTIDTSLNYNNGTFNSFDAGQLFFDVTESATPPATAVPFEFSPSMGLLALGGLWGAMEVRKRMKS